MCGASSSSAAGDGGSGYDEKLRRIQVHLRDRSKQKHTKLKRYLKEICERQKKSLLRNQDLLKEFDCIEAHIRKFASRSESLQKLKAEYERQVKSRLALQKNSTLKDDGEDNVKQLTMAEARQAGINTRTAMSTGLYHTATIFMGRQMSAVSDADDFGELQKSSQLTKSFSIPDPHAHTQPSQSSSVTDSCVVQTNSDLQCLNQSDKTHGRTYLPAGAEMPVTSGVSSENGRTCGVTVERQANNCGSNFMESKESPEVNSLLHGRLSPENKGSSFKSDSLRGSVGKVLTHEHSVLNEQGSKRPISLTFHPEEAVSGNEYSREKFPVLRESLQLASGAQVEENESLDESSDLTVSLSEEEEEDEEPFKQQKSMGDVGSKTSLETASATHNKEAPPKEGPPCSYTSSPEASAGSPVRGCLSFEGLCSVLQHIEEMTARVASECLMLYKSKPVNSAELEALISICNQTGSLEQEDLEVCEALVLHQLQRLLQSTMNGCLLPEEALNDKSGMLGEKQTRPELSSYFARIWERLNKHVMFLKEHNVVLTQEVKDMLATLLVLERNKQDSLVMSLLKENCPEECVDESSPCSNVTSCSSQANKIKHENHTQLLGSNGAREHEVTNWSEDESKEESLVEKIPVSGLNIDGRSLKEQKSNATSSEASFSSREKRSPLSRDENQKGKIAVIKSKAFWGDSDDSNSDIEAALRPQAHSSREDDFSDFYD
ncbi:PREDICTED: centrosomal protein kizuna [Gekko japonicus]|uniref:Centrosomal protein kizuna n=1 Tax=Gekko japonicus TaxID=146911 RepID=A0ABM1JJQ9_GEKJA|nr:PREDICTED: centrosomal protein kizuna [Gekko japonicus]